MYSGRNENLVRPLFERYARETGTDVHVRYGDTAELVATLAEEGERTRADLFLSQDAGAVAALADRGMLTRLPVSVTSDVPGAYADPGGRWVGVTGRSRVVAYNPDRVGEDDLPASTFDVADPRWRGRVGLAPTNASFVAHMSALAQERGRTAVERFLRDLAANDAKVYDSNVLVVRAVAAGEVDLGLVNHYYVLNTLREDPDAAVANHFPEEAAFVNVSAAAVLRGSDRRQDAVALVQYLLSRAGQEYFVDETSELPLRRGMDGPRGVPALDDLPTLGVPLARLGADLRETTELVKRAGLG